MTDPFAKRVGEDRVAAVLQLIAAKPRRRERAVEGGPARRLRLLV